MLCENRKLMYAGNRHNDKHYRSLPEIHFTATDLFLKTFDRLTVCAFWSLFLFFLTAIYMIYKPVEQTHYCVEVFRISREKTVQSMCYQKIYIKVYLMHKMNHA